MTAFDIPLTSTSLAGHPAAITGRQNEFAVRCSIYLESHCTPGGVSPPLGINDWGIIQPGASLIPLTPTRYVQRLEDPVIAAICARTHKYKKGSDWKASKLSLEKKMLFSTPGTPYFELDLLQYTGLAMIVMVIHQVQDLFEVLTTTL